MRNSAVEENRSTPTQIPGLTPLVSALRRALRFVPRRPPNKPGPDRSHAAAPIHFEPIEPRILLSGDVNPAALSISGEIGVPGEKDVYEFTAQDSHRIVFDSLTDRSDLNWTLEGPTGELAHRGFGTTDYAAASPAFELTPGTYRITIDGQQDATGAYALRVIDAEAAADMTPGVEVIGTLDGGNDTAVYRFTANGGDRFFFKAGTLQSASQPAVNWRLIDPYGRQEGVHGDLGNDRDSFAVEHSGEYLLLVEGYQGNQAPVDFSFNLHPVADTDSAMLLNAITTAAIDQFGRTARFSFTLNEETPVLFDWLGAGDFHWSLTGPRGEQIGRHRAVDGEGRWLGGNDRLLLAAGTYTISIDSDGAALGSYPFRLLSAEGATPLTLDQPTAGRLDSARGSILYKVGLNRGDRLFFAGGPLSGGDLSWRLLDPYGRRLTGAAFGATGHAFPVDADGEYWLVLDGAETNAADAEIGFEFRLNRVPAIAGTLIPGEAVNGTIDLAGREWVYEFNLTDAAQWVFAAQSARADILWSLTGPQGTQIQGQGFDQSGATLLDLVAGSYRLAVTGVGNATGDFSFRMMDLAASAVLPFGTALAGELTPTAPVQTFRFLAAAGDNLEFDSLALSGGNANWRLIDPYGRDVAGDNSLGQDSAPFTLATGGTHTLLVVNDLGNASPVNYSLQCNRLGNTPPAPLPEGVPLTFGEVLAGTLPSWDATQIYLFSLASDSRIIMDAQSSSSAVWTVTGPRGTEVSERRFYNSDSLSGNPVLDLKAGDYSLTVQGGSPWSYYGNGAYAFQLLDAETLPELLLGQQTTAVRSPANATLGYRFEAAAGTRLVLNHSTDQTGSGWRLIDPYGREVTANTGANPGLTYAISSSGGYLLLNEGYFWVSGSANVTFTLSPQDLVEGDLMFNSPASGTLAGRQSLARYSFTLDRNETLVFDAMDAWVPASANVQWCLEGASGVTTGWNALSGSDLNAYALVPGKYSLTLRNIEDLPASYKFRLLDRTAGAVLEPGTPVTETIAAGENRLYRFNGLAGERYYFDGQNDYYADRWMLLDPLGSVLASGDARQGRDGITLSGSGEYLLLITPYQDPFSPDTPRNVSFNLIPESVRDGAFSLNTDITGTITQPRERVTYAFTLIAPAQLLVDGWNTSGDLNWSLTGPRGNEATQRRFDDDSNVFNLPAGDYEFSVGAYKADGNK